MPRRRFIRWGWGLAAALALAGGAWLVRPLPSAKAACSLEERQALAALAGEIHGDVVFQREGPALPESIWKCELGDRRAFRLAEHGRFPRWSPDGRWIAFIRGREIVCMTAGGRRERVLARGEETSPRALTWHPNGREVWFTEGTRIRAADRFTGQVRTVRETPFLANLDLDDSGRRLIITIRGHQMLACEPPETGALRPLAAGCSATLSPDGRWFTRNTGRHQWMAVHRWEDASQIGEFHAPPGRQIDNEKWSNHARWLVLRANVQTNGDIFAWNPFEDRGARVTFFDDANRPDLFVRPAPAGWIGQLAAWIRRYLRIY